ncbi:MAG: methyltransferase domain-containing protein [Rickettsiaceae bacterium]|nr:MAG: methyltransferase domain-containing protein [Rickettsiaceae bacterium]
MYNPFSQPKIIYGISFKISFEYIAIVEQLLVNYLGEEILSISTTEVFSQTVESMPQDLWSINFHLKTIPNIALINSLIEDFSKDQNIIISTLNEYEVIEDHDWVELYNSQLKPIETEKFFISSRDQQQLCPENKIGIYINASRAFGTGDHATTLSCIEAITKLSKCQIKSIFDIGTGTGILSFAAEHIWPLADVLACDIEQVAIDIAQENGHFNNSKVQFYVNYEHSILIDQYLKLKFDVVLANILAAPLISMSAHIRSMMNLNGYIILSGFLDYQADEIIDCFNNLDFKVIDIIYKNSWTTITFKLDSKQEKIDLD